MYSPGDKEQVLPAPETSLLPWPVHKTSKSAVLANDWERFPHPKELQYLPDVEQTPYELRQIIKRSLYEYEPTSSSSPLSKAEIPDPEAQAALTPTMLPDGPEKQTRESVGSVHSEETCHGGDEAPAAAAVSGTTFVPSSLDAHIPKPRELKSKSSFLSAKIERLGAKIEKLELVASRRSSRSAEQPKVVVTVECASCLEDVPKSDVTSLSCTHTYCGPCFTTLVTTAMQTESLFPPKCCLTEIPLKTVLYALDDQQRSSYKQKAAEWAQPMEKRWYCPEPTCAKWIAPSKLHRSWTTGLACPHCQTSICRTCRGLAHAKDTPCPQDFGLNAMLDIAEREGWRRCYQCKVLVEKTSGCRHMTCTCKAQFCYTCGSKWKTCGCTEVDQARREEELRERRMAVDAEARWEGEAIARAIAEVEAAERREAQEREAAERRREDERRREEEELRRLEELRLAEEEQRRRDEEDAERKRIETINSSIEERTSSLAKMLTELVQIQQMALISRHDNTMQTVRTASEARRASRQEDYDRQKQKLLTNIENRSRRMKQKHDTEMTTTRARHESEEDAMFMQVQMHLHGKPNQKAREKAIMDSLRQSHKDELARLARTQTEEAADLREVAEVEARSLGYGHWAHLEKIKNGTELKMVDLDRQVMAERHWFEGVARRRHALLEDLRNDLLRTMGESHLLDEWEALPFPPAVPRFSFSEDGPDLLNQSTPTPDSSLTPQSSSPGTPEEVPAVPVTADPSSSVLPCTKPAKPSLFISTVMAESHTASEESSQSVWETQSHRAGQSGTASTTSRLSVHLQRRGGVKADKVSRWSFLSSSKKEQVDDETWKGDVRRTVAGVF